MAYYGGRGNYYGGLGYPARSPINVIYNPYGNFNQPNFQSAYVNRGFNPSPLYPGGYGQPLRRQPAIAPRPQPRAEPQPRNSRMLILCTIFGLVALLVVLGIAGAIVGIVFSSKGSTTQPPEITTASLSVALNMEYSPALANPTSNEYQGLAMQFETEMARNLGDQFEEVKVTSFRPGSVVVTFTVECIGQCDPESITMAVQQAVSSGMLGSLSVDPNSVQANQGDNGGGTNDPQPTQAPVLTQAPQPQPTQAPQPQPTQAPQPQPTQAPQPQPTQAPQPQPTVAPQPQPTVAPQPQPTVAPQPQPTVAPPAIDGDIFSTRICGTQPALNSRIIGGNNAQLGHWPWIGSLQVGGSPSCGATLLNERWAITAAHCFLDVPANDPRPDSIVFGITNTRTPESGSQSTGFRTFHHPNYVADDQVEKRFDITLLQLSGTITFTNNINPICLATLVEETAMYTECQAAGWGNLNNQGEGFEDYPDALQEVDLPLVSSAACGFSSDIICAGRPEGGVDSCQGDSGGPLICQNRVDESWHLVGITSSGAGCALPNSPGLYTRVTQFQDWIQTTINQNP